MIAILDNTLTEEEVNYCIGSVQNISPTSTLDGRQIYCIQDLFHSDVVFNKIMNNLEKIALQFVSSICIDWSEIVYWPEGTDAGMHYDYASEETVFTSVSYLNNNYCGGETFFEDGTLISPVLGRTVFFDGQRYKHGVLPISTGARYSLPVWYKKV